MSFHIVKQKAALADGFRAALRGELVRTARDLDVSSRAAPGPRIFRARKRVKKVRSALRLLEAASFPAVSRTDHSLLRDACAEIAPAHGADANLGTLKTLCDDSGCDPLRFSRAFEALEKRRQAIARGTPASMRKAATLLKGSLSRIEAWDDRAIPWKDIARALERSYKRARKAFRKAVDEPSAESLHTWRKRSQDILHGLQLTPAGESKPARRLKKLCSLLGEVHDLTLLRQALDEFRLGKEKPRLDKLISARREKAQARAFKLAAKCFSRKPADFIEKVTG